MNLNLSSTEIQDLIVNKLSHFVGVKLQDANDEQIYRAVALVVEDMIVENRHNFMDEVQKVKPKQVYYICMEFLLGRSLKNNLSNLKLLDKFSDALKTLGFDMEEICQCEADAALGNGGLGRLAACYLDALASKGYAAMGYSLRYEYGVFKQKLVDGWQTELPDFWLQSGGLWLTPRPEEAVRIYLNGEVHENWDWSHHQVEIKNANEIIAMPYDMMVAGHGANAVCKLRLWAAESREFNMDLFNKGDYARAVEQNAMAAVITKVLYPADNHPEGKSLRLSQQYFLVSATVQDIVRRHLKIYKTLENLPDEAIIHLNDTHPVLAIPELMRLMLDECGYTWEKAWDLVSRTFAYTNHTVMTEALEVWGEDLLRRRIPRIYQIIVEINNRMRESLKNSNIPEEQIQRMLPMNNGIISMPNLAILSSYKVNGVSALHTEILKNTVFKDFYQVFSEKFINVTNGITHRRWLNQANPELSKLIGDLIGEKYITEPEELQNLLKFKDDKSALRALERVKLHNKERLARFIKENTGILVDPSSIFDTQIKRLHEYKRQLMNALNVLDTYIKLKESPSMLFSPKTYIFAAKAAPSYYFAKEIIKLIYKLQEMVNNDPLIKEKLKVVFIEDYRVSLAEMLIPASEISEQISLAGTEASGTSNMKFMLNGAITLGTLDGANVEISEAVGPENIIIFGMKADEVNSLKKNGYDPMRYYNNNCAKIAIDRLNSGIGGTRFESIANYLVREDHFMVLADFSDYSKAQNKASELYSDRDNWNRMSLVNIANAGRFSADFSIENYAKKIWNVTPVKENQK